MIISFDLDDTLIPATKFFDTEPRNVIQKLAGVENIRKGTIELFKALKIRGHKIYIYTTSFRSTFRTKLAFYLYGIPVDKVINQECHDAELKENRGKCSKFPPAFGIDLHVDDSYGLQIEGERFNFRTLIIGEQDQDWVKKVLANLPV